MSQPVNNSDNNVQIVGGIIFLFYILGFLFPNTFWGMHYPAFLSSGTSLIVLGFAALLLFIGPNLFQKNALEQFPKTKQHGVMLSVGLSLVMGLVFYSFPILFDLYGDSLWVKPNGVVLTEISEKHWSELTSFDFTDLKIGTKTVFGVAAALAVLMGDTLDAAFWLIDLVAGMLFVFIWIRFVLRKIEGGTLRWAMIVMGVTAPLTLHFCQHYEIYAITYNLVLLYAIVLIEFIETRKALWLWIQVPLLVICLKFHITSILLFPTFGMSLLLHFGGDKLKVLKLKGALLYLLLPMLVMGVGIYIMTDSAFGNRAYGTDTWDTVFFLPLSALEGPPYDRYNLFSWNHIFDYFNLFFLWSSVALFVLGTMLVKWSKKLDWNRPEIVFLIVTFLVYVAFFFVFNPLLGMTADWDLMSIPALILMPLIVMLAKQLDTTDFSKEIVAGSFAFGILCMCGIFVNSNQETLSQHYESIGRRDFTTYWRGTSTTIVAGVQMGQVEEMEERFESVCNDLEPYAVMGKDIEYSEVLRAYGQYYIDIKKDYVSAGNLFEKSQAYCPELRQIDYSLVVSYFIQQRFTEAFQLLPNLVQKQFPDQRKAYKMAIHVAVEANEYNAALNYCTDYLSIYPEDHFIHRVSDSLATSAHLDSVKFMFRQK